MKPGEGKYYPFKVVVPAGKRKTVKLDDLVWTEGSDNIIAAEAEPPADPVQVTFDATDVSTVIYSDRGIVAERAMYFDYYGKEGGSNSIGATGTSAEWYLPEGYTGGDFDTWILAMNPSGYTVDITYTFYSNEEGFAPVSVIHENVAPWSRDSINVDQVPGLEGTDVSTKVTATRPVTLYGPASVDDPVERYALLYGVEGDQGLQHRLRGLARTTCTTSSTAWWTTAASPTTRCGTASRRTTRMRPTWSTWTPSWLTWTGWPRWRTPTTSSSSTTPAPTP